MRDMKWNERKVTKLFEKKNCPTVPVLDRLCPLKKTNLELQRQFLPMKTIGMFLFQGTRNNGRRQTQTPRTAKENRRGIFFSALSIIIILIMITGVIVINHKNHNNRIIISMNLRGVKKLRVGEETIDCIQRGSSTSVISIMSLVSHLTAVVSDIVVIVQ